MTSVAVPPDVDAATAAPPADGTSRHRRTVPAVATPYAVFAVFALALGVRLFEIRTAYNIFVDEVTYTLIARNLGTGDGLTLFGEPFTLHPPVALTLLGLFDRVTGSTGEALDQQVLALRVLPAVFGALGVAVAYAVAARLAAGRVVPLGVAAVLALNPFGVYFDSRVLLEPFAGLFVALSALLLLRATTGDGPVRQRRLTVAGAALSAGLAFATKETFGLVWAATLIALLLLPGLTPRRTTGQVLLGGAAVYAAIVGVVWSFYGPATWWQSHTSGLHRLIGTQQSTGFNAASTKVSLTERVVANLDQYAVTYVLLAAGTVAAIVVLLRARVWRRRERTPRERGVLVVATWTAAASGYLAYATAFGSIEEQMYYIPLLPCVLTLGLLWDRRRAVSGRATRAAVAVLAVAALVASATVWVDQRRTDHNRYAQFLAWARTNLDDGVTIAVADVPAQFLVQRAVIGLWETPALWREHQVDYVLVDSTLVEQGYSLMSPPVLRQLQASAPVVFSTTSDGSTLALDEFAAATGP